MVSGVAAGADTQAVTAGWSIWGRKTVQAVLQTCLYQYADGKPTLKLIVAILRPTFL